VTYSLGWTDRRGKLRFQVKLRARNLAGLAVGASCLGIIGSQVAYAHPGNSAGDPTFTQRAIPRVPVDVNHAKSISPVECAGRNWVVVSVKANVPQRYLRATVRTKIDRSWMFSYEKDTRDKALRINIKGSCDTIYRMLEAGATRARFTINVSAPGYRDTKLRIEIPVRY